MEHSKSIKRLASLFKSMVKNYNSFGNWWKNIPLAHEAFAIMTDELPEVLPGEYETPEERAKLMMNMLDVCNELDMPRFCIEVREFIDTIAPNDINSLKLKKLRDFIDMSIDGAKWCKTYGAHLRFDEVERTEEWEAVIYEVERRCASRLRFARKGMGFCFHYWSVKQDILMGYGIEWSTPSQMNPGVMFD